MDRSDAEIVRDCLDGRRGAWEKVVRLHHPRIYNLAYRYTARFDEAEDLTQEIFIKVFRSLATYRPDAGPLVAWIVRVGRNHIVDRYRQRRLERASTEEIDDRFERIEQNPGRYSSPAEALERREVAEVVHQALLRLPLDLREAVIYRDLEGQTYEEISETLRIPLGTVKSRISRGRAELARSLGRFRGRL